MTIILTTDELERVTGYKTPAAQRMGAHSTQAQTADYIRNKKAIKSTATR